MTIARLGIALLLLILLSDCGGAPCHLPITSVAVPDCSPPPIANPTWTLRDDRPDLPEGVACLRGPLAIRVAEYVISSPFRDPGHCWTPGTHTGTDFPTRADAQGVVKKEVLASAAGEVVAVSQEYESVWSVEVRFGKGWNYRVVHLSDIAVHVGDKVDIGELLGKSGGEKGAAGSGPYTSGPHLHFSLMYHGAYVDAEKYFCRSYPHSEGVRVCPNVCR